jgi:RNA polymerase sigma-70 factor (ECF subfamily)
MQAHRERLDPGRDARQPDDRNSGAAAHAWSEAAVARLYTEHHPALFRYLVRLTGDADLAADAAQETFTRLLEKSPAGEHVRAWLFTVATNCVRAWCNSRRRRSELVQANAERAAVSDAPLRPDVQAEQNQTRRAVQTALAALSAKERTVLLMREEGFAHREIAQAVGTTTGSVGTMIARALDKLAERLPLDVEDRRPS